MTKYEQVEKMFKDNKIEISIRFILMEIIVFYGIYILYSFYQDKKVGMMCKGDRIIKENKLLTIQKYLLF